MEDHYTRVIEQYQIRIINLQDEICVLEREIREKEKDIQEIRNRLAEF